MNQCFCNVIVSNENTVKLIKFTPQLATKEQLIGKLNLDKINDKIREIIKAPTNLKGEQITKVGEALFEALFDAQLREYFLAYYQDILKQSPFLAMRGFGKVKISFDTTSSKFI